MIGFKTHTVKPVNLIETQEKLTIFCTIALASLMFGCSDQNTKGTVKKGSSAPTQVERGEITQRITAPGVIVPKRSSMISTPYAGYVRKVFVSVGDRVASGASIVSVVQSASTPDSEVFPLRAPFAGTVVQILKSEGEYVELGGTNSALVRIDDLTQLHVDAAVAELDYPKLKLNQSVRIRVSALTGKLYRGAIRRISLAAREKKDFMRGTIEFPVRIEVLDADSELKPGMSATLDVIADQRSNALRVSNTLLRRTSEGYEVTLKTGETRKVKVGLQSDEYSEILEGLNEGDELLAIRTQNARKSGHSP